LFNGTLVAFCLVWTTVDAAPDVSTNSASAGIDAVPAAKETVDGILREVSEDVTLGDLDKALPEVDYAIQLDSRNASAYELRGSIYIQKKLWDLAQRDYTTASTIDPTSAVYKYKLAQIKFLQRYYDNARPGFAALQNDEYLGDLSTYRVFLCDLLGGHEDRAAKDLAAMNQAGGNPSYYFSNAAWNFYHQNKKEAMRWLNEAQYIYDAGKRDPYMASLMETQRIQFPIITFVTKSGEKYDKVAAVYEDAQLQVRMPSGSWEMIPFDQLPDDVSNFPAEWRRQIEAKRQMDSEADGSRALLTFTTKQGKKYDQVKWSVDDAGLFVLTSDGWVLVPFDRLPDDLSSFSVEAQKEISAKRQIVPDATTHPDLLSFATKKGKPYDQVKWSMDDNGLFVLTSDGWLLVPFDQLPEDLSSFPLEVRKEISAKRQAVLDAGTGTTLLSFTDKQGRPYDQVKWSFDDTGLFVLTSDGWILIPFDQLPEDLSPFPPEVRKRIGAKRQAVLDAGTGMTLLSFTTKRGKEYDQVKWSFDDTGLFVLTSDGWILIPFDQLPENLSPFPLEVRKEISAKRQAVLDANTGAARISFTDKRGRQYDQVRWSFGDTGLFVLTSEGWILVPIDQLPEDLSFFPPEVRKRIGLKQNSLLPEHSPASLSTGVANPVSEPK
jgi:hypothetical protein